MSDREDKWKKYALLLAFGETMGEHHALDERIQRVFSVGYDHGVTWFGHQRDHRREPLRRGIPIGTACSIHREHWLHVDFLPTILEILTDESLMEIRTAYTAGFVFGAASVNDVIRSL